MQKLSKRQKFNRFIKQKVGKSKEESKRLSLIHFVYAVKVNLSSGKTGTVASVYEVSEEGDEVLVSTEELIRRRKEAKLKCVSEEEAIKQLLKRLK